MPAVQGSHVVVSASSSEQRNIQGRLGKVSENKVFTFRMHSASKCKKETLMEPNGDERRRDSGKAYGTRVGEDDAVFEA